MLILDAEWPLQHAHIDNIKSVANLSNNKDLFMCILRFHARAGYLQHYEALLKELNSRVPEDTYQYVLLCTDKNQYIPVHTGMY